MKRLLVGCSVVSVVALGWQVYTALTCPVCRGTKELR